MVAVAGVAVTVALIDKAGRRVFTVPPQWICTVVFLVIGLWSGAPAAVVLGLFLVFSFFNAMNGTLTSIYPGEVFPTEVRGLGTGFAAAVSRIGAGFGTFLLPIVHENFGVSASMLAVAVIAFSRCRGVTAVGSGDEGDEPQRDGRRVCALADVRLNPLFNPRIESETPRGQERRSTTCALSSSAPASWAQPAPAC